MNKQPFAVAVAMASCAVLTPTPVLAQVTATAEPFVNELSRRLNSTPALIEKFLTGATATPSAQVPTGLLLNNVALTGNVVQAGEATLDTAPVVSAAAVGTYTIPNCGLLPMQGKKSTSYNAGTTSTATWTDTKSLTVTNTLDVKAKIPGGQVQDTLTTNYNQTQTKGSSTTNTMQMVTSDAASFWVPVGKAVRLDFTNTVYDIKGSPVTYQVKPEGSVTAVLASKTVTGKSAWSYDGTYGIATQALPGWTPMTYGGNNACATAYNSKTYIGTAGGGKCNAHTGERTISMQTYTAVWMHPALEWESSWNADTKVPAGSPYPSWAQGLACVDKGNAFGHTDSNGICLTVNSRPDSTRPGYWLSQYGKMLRYRQSGLVAVPTTVLEQADPQGLVVPVKMTVTAQISKNDVTARTTEVPVDPPCIK